MHRGCITRASAVNSGRLIEALTMEKRENFSIELVTLGPLQRHDLVVVFGSAERLQASRLDLIYQVTSFKQS